MALLFFCLEGIICYLLLLKYFIGPFFCARLDSVYLCPELLGAIFIKWDHLCPRYLGVIFSPEWDYLCPRYLGMIFSPKCDHLYLRYLKVIFSSKWGDHLCLSYVGAIFQLSGAICALRY